MTTVIPAFGRNYANADQAQIAWHNGLDFIETYSQRAANKSDLPGLVVIRYGAKLTKVTSYNPAKDGPRIQRKLDKELAAKSEVADFDAWLKELDSHVVKATDGMGIDELPDWDFRAAHDARTAPADAAKEMLAELGFE